MASRASYRYCLVVILWYGDYCPIALAIDDCDWWRSIGLEVTSFLSADIGPSMASPFFGVLFSRPDWNSPRAYLFVPWSYLLSA